MIEIIPAMDLIGGKCVRLTKGDFGAGKIYCDDPVGQARGFESDGARRLHLVDLDGARQGEPVHLETLKMISSATRLAVDFSGGLRSLESVEAAFGSGASMVCIGSLAYSNRELFDRMSVVLGTDRIILAADVESGKIAIHGWENRTGTSVEDFIRGFHGCGLRRVLCTDIGRDGCMSGPAIELYARLIGLFPEMDFIASGGVSSQADIEELDKTGVRSVVVGKALYEGAVKLAGRC